MKKTIFSALFLASILFSGTSNAQTLASAAKVNTTKETKSKTATAYKIDPAQSTMTWNGKKVTGEHNGTVKIASGELQADKNKVVAGNVVIDMNSIVNLDVTDKDYNQKLVGHLKSDDFFSTEKHPNATFKISNITPVKAAKAGAPNATVNGVLTIKGIAQPVSFPAVVNVQGNTITAKSDAVTLDRTKWDIRYGSKSFFANIGDKAIHDDFTVQFNLVAKK
ncbi:YceI family protein [Adhaeribacter rhizoryzae]|uniref:YceI family protein n=1 Tax=Adhaeribacter rhizoryzae TaxID=2607907 RepID=A0A5M6DS34_9BACT|nr:YceI family protein [Adhaeribacter rhizoryzae]KAA5548215.1 YceI family protein [Adhaeribacter rhizoryzae]